MPALSRIVIAASDLRHAAPIQAHFRQMFELDVPVVRFDQVMGLLTPETDGSVLLYAHDSTDAAAVETVVRETKVQQFPVGLAVIESDAVRNSRLLDLLTPYLVGRWAWPQHMREVTNWAQRALHAATSFAGPMTETTTARIRHRLINHTPSLTALVEQLAIAADHDVTALIEGETGTGKSYLAKLIHDCSARRAHRLVSVACGSIPANQIAGELFGHADGSKIGKLAAAGEGTILLDEIDTLSAEHQANLLRVLESGEFEPVGGTETQVCQARILAATNWSLAEAVERGTFRRDLFYRLHVIGFQLPALRHRTEDIGPLVRGMVARYGTRFGKKLFGVCPEALQMLEAFPWPGNIRQLENVIQQAVLTSSGNELKVHHLSPLIHTRAETNLTATPMPAAFGGITLKQSRESSDRAAILRALEKAGQSRTRAAQLLGISRVTLYKKMWNYGLITKSNTRHVPN